MGSAAPLSLEIRWDGRRIAGVGVDSGRPVLASRVLEGHAVAHALATVPRLFTVCRAAQRVAAELACELAAGGIVDASRAAQAELEVLAESALESLWWLLLEWPARMGEAPRPENFARMRANVVRLLDARTPEWELIARELDEFLSGPAYREAVDRLTAQLQADCADDDRAALLPWLDAAALRDEIAPAVSASDEFARAPLWRGVPAETGALARGRNGTDAARRPSSRVAARIAELETIAPRMRALAAGDSPSWVRGAAIREGCALAAVETARGTLVHAVELSGDVVRRWRIVAPTEWNFHPAGAFAQGLVGRAAASSAEARRAGEMLACALDPCVEYRVGVAHA